MPAIEPSPPGQREFVLLISGVMMLVAFAIDSMLPALPAIGNALGVSVDNERQFVITAFMIGFGVAQFFVGTLSDRFGRRGLMLGSLFAFAITSLGATLASSFDLLLIARVAQGMAAAGARVLVTSVVRDRFEGRAMAQVMSLASVIFMAAPVLAPAMGQLILAVAPWRWIFAVLMLLGLAVWGWVLFRLPETLDPANASEISLIQFKRNARIILTDRQSVGYGIANTCLTAGLMGFLTSVQQVFETIFARPDLLVYGFAIMASGMAVASLINARIVMRYGMRLIGHSAMIGYTLIAGVHALVALSGHESLVSFIALQTLMMVGFSFAAANFGAMAMANMGGVAGTATSLQGSFSTICGAVIGAAIGQSFNGTTIPLYLGFFTCGSVALIAVFVTEGGRLFVARNAPTHAE
jgi:DHA1 family bicyclomycin/chloramphenicol resistance-like MFS transporter